MVVNRPYETTFIVTPDLAPEDYNSIIEKFNKIISDAGAEIVNQEIWGYKKLAYPIVRKNSGYFVFTEFNGPGTLIERLEREFTYDEKIIRFLTVKLEKDAVAYNIKRRDKLKTAKANS